MLISKTAEYALRAVVYLAREPTSLRTRDEIAKATKVPAEYLTKTLQRLAERGVIRVRRGARGGYLLSRPPEKLTVLEVVLAVEPSSRLDGCPLELAEHADDLCPLHARLDAAAAVVEKAFRETRISELVPRPRGMKSIHTKCTFPAADQPATRSRS